MIQTNSVIGNVSDDAKLVFQRYGDRYFFAQVQMAGDSTSFAAVKSSAQRAQKEAVAAGSEAKRSRDRRRVVQRTSYRPGRSWGTPCQAEQDYRICKINRSGLWYPVNLVNPVILSNGP